MGAPCGGFGTDIGYVNIVGPGKGKGQGWGTDIGDVNTWGGVGDRNGYAHIMGVGCFGTDIGDVNILGGREPWVEIGDVNIVRRWRWGFGVEIGEINI